MRTNKDTYFNSMKRTLTVVGTECVSGVLPIENLPEGYIEVVLDLLMDGKLEIVRELTLANQFAFVSYAGTYKEIKHIFVQHAAKLQCGNFIDSFQNVPIVRTKSHFESLDLLNKHSLSSGAIVPIHAVAVSAFPLIVPNVNDHKNNMTSCIVFAWRGPVEIQ